MDFTLSNIILLIMGFGIIIGGIDRILGNKYGLGEQFEEGFNAMGPLALGMVGIMVLAPVIANTLAPILTPLYGMIGADPSMFATILANDMGGYPLAKELAINSDIGLYSGLIVASMLGCTIVFSIPVGLSIIEKSDHKYFAKGLLAGIIAIPVGSIIGGLIAGISLNLLLINSIPIIVLSILLVLGLKFAQELMIKGSILFGKFIVIIGTIGIIIGGFQYILTAVGTDIVILKNAPDILDQLYIIGLIGVVLLGTFPILTLLTKILEKPLVAAGEKMGMDKNGAAGLVFTLANSIPVYKMMKDMSPRGIVINTAWLVCATAALGDHLGFTAGVEASYITPVVIGKIVGGIVGVMIALSITKDLIGVDRSEA